MSDLRRLVGLIRPYRLRFAAAVIASGLAALFTVALPVLVQPLVEGLGLGRGSRHAVPVDLPILPSLGVPVYSLVLIAFLGKGVFSYLSQYLMVWVGERAVLDLRAAVGSAIAHQSVGYFTGRTTGELVARVTSDAERVLTTLSEKLYDVVKEPMTMLALAGYLFWVEWPLAVVALLVAPLVVLPIARFGRKLRRASERSQQRMGELANRVAEVVAGVRVVKAWSAEEHESRRIAAAARGVFDSNLKAARVVALTPPLMELLAGIGIAAAFFYGHSRIDAGRMGAGEFLSFMTALFLLYTPAKKLSRVQAALAHARIAARRCFAVIDAPREVVEAPGALALGTVKGEVRLEGVSFRYEERWVLRDLDLEIPVGSSLALVGRSGAGKTTITNLILRFYDPTAGRVAIDGRDVRDYTLRSLREKIGLVAQDVVLFNDSLAANIAYGLERVTDAAVEAAARAARAHDFIAELPEGYDTVVGERGVRLSAGQRQRVAIARALLKDPPILVLDEATSALDAESEALVVEALNNLMRGRTTLIVAHRLATVRRADLIVVLEGGRLREIGTHDELLRDGGLYNRLAELQAVGEIR